jgi:molybdenum cofactor synthesis domain-containing protein
MSPELDLFGKTEVWITGISLTDVDLGELAVAAALVLGLTSQNVFVTDVRDDHVVFDVLVPSIPMDQVVGRKTALLDALAAVTGVRIQTHADVHSYGVLGILGTPAEEVDAVLRRATEIDQRLRQYVSRRVAVVSTGPEVAAGEITDTNLAAIAELLRPEGFTVESGGMVDDDETAIAGLVARLIADGYGVVITTGGVGAEDKDRTIEALTRIVPDISTAVLATYEVGHGRHVKPEVRIAAGRIHDALVVALPGPTREVRAALPALIESVAAQEPTSVMVERLAEPIRKLWHHS